MTLENLLSQRKNAILERWFKLILETYPPDASRFLEREKDSFNNPVGFTISQETKAIYEQLLQEMNSDKLSTSLENILKIRAVQDFSPSQAVSFIFLLKKAVKEELANQGDHAFEELLEFDHKVDKLALLAFDIYMKSREKIFQLRVNEVRAESEIAFRLLNRINRRESEE